MAWSVSYPKRKTYLQALVISIKLIFLLDAVPSVRKLPNMDYLILYASNFETNMYTLEGCHFYMLFKDASTHIYMRLYPFIRRSDRRWVDPRVEIWIPDCKQPAYNLLITCKQPAIHLQQTTCNQIWQISLSNSIFIPSFRRIFDRTYLFINLRVITESGITWSPTSTRKLPTNFRPLCLLAINAENSSYKSKYVNKCSGFTLCVWIRV